MTDVHMGCGAWDAVGRTPKKEAAADVKEENRAGAKLRAHWGLFCRDSADTEPQRTCGRVVTRSM